jgi:hypothetical protein
MRYACLMAENEKYHGVSNEDAHRADQERRRSNAGGSHDSRPKRERSRSAVRAAEIRRNAA